jgi:hypothetical protein
MLAHHLHYDAITKHQQRQLADITKNNNDVIISHVKSLITDYESFALYHKIQAASGLSSQIPKAFPSVSSHIAR